MEALEKKILLQVDKKIEEAQKNTMLLVDARIQNAIYLHKENSNHAPGLTIEEILEELPPIYIPATEGTVEVRLGEDLPPMKFIVTTEKGIPTQDPVSKYLSETVTIRLVPRESFSK